MSAATDRAAQLNVATAYITRAATHAATHTATSGAIQDVTRGYRR